MVGHVPECVYMVVLFFGVVLGMFVGVGLCQIIFANGVFC